jgi:addiction module HigA family antidote
MMAKLAPMHPGEVLREEFLVPLGLKPYGVAKMLDIPRTRIERIAAEEIGITADTALRLGKLFGTSAEFWLNLQSRYDMLMAQKEIGRELNKIRPAIHARAAS